MTVRRMLTLLALTFDLSLSLPRMLLCTFGFLHLAYGDSPAFAGGLYHTDTEPAQAGLANPNMQTGTVVLVHATGTVL